MSTISSRAKGAWVITHSLKLQKVDASGQFSSIETAGKFGRLLSALSSTEQQVIPKALVTTIANINSINPTLDLQALLGLMEKRHLIKTSESGDVGILGITHGSVLERTAEAFDSLSPAPQELAVLEMSEMVSGAPVRSREMVDHVSGTFSLKKKHANEIIEQAEEIGFIDAEDLDVASHDKLYFNGNIFRGKDANKTHRVLESLSSDEQRKVREFDEKLSALGYITTTEAQALLGNSLFEKLQAIALFDVNTVANRADRVLYVTRPASFAKYGNPWEEDTLDYAKAFVSSLAYGMTRSGPGRGRITMLRRLMSKLIDGEWLGESTAAGEDYKYLEMRRVVETRPGTRAGCYTMRLLKKDVGIVALEVLTQGAASSESLMGHLPGASVDGYSGPEANRIKIRKKRTVAPPSRAVVELLQSIRTGGQVG